MEFLFFNHKIYYSLKYYYLCLSKSIDRPTYALFDTNKRFSNIKFETFFKTLQGVQLEKQSLHA